jgi:sRNA-binding protein
MPKNPALRVALARLAADRPLPPLLERLRRHKPPLPMKVGIDADLHTLYPEARSTVKRLLASIASRADYVAACLAPGAQRHDLDCAPVGPVEDDRAHLKARLLTARQKRQVAPSPQPAARTGRNGRPILSLRKR